MHTFITPFHMWAAAALQDLFSGFPVNAHRNFACFLSPIPVVPAVLCKRGINSVYNPSIISYYRRLLPFNYLYKPLYIGNTYGCHKLGTLFCVRIIHIYIYTISQVKAGLLCRNLRSASLRFFCVDTAFYVSLYVKLVIIKLTLIRISYMLTLVLILTYI